MLLQTSQEHGTQNGIGPPRLGTVALDSNDAAAYKRGMTVFIALLRGVNVGGHKMVAMADLRGMLSDLGFADPQTLLQSGNLVFRGNGPGGRRLEATLEQAAADRLGLRTEIMVRTAAEWASIVASNPFPDAANDDPSHLVLMALKDAPTEQAVDDLRSAISGPETIHAVGRQLYITYPAGIGRSKLTQTLIESRLKTRCTGRNWRTVLELALRTG